MKKNFIYATLSAIALVGAVSLTSCSSNEDVVDVNPTYDGEAVKTQFTISLPFGNNATTRQTGSVVQVDENKTSFRGMSNIVLIPFSHATNRTTRLGGNITLGENKMLQPTTSNAENAIPNGQLLAASNAVLYKDVTIPVGTAGFLFYGKATGDDGFANGSLTAPDFANGSLQTSEISFTPSPVITTSNPLVTTTRDKIITYINLIAAAADATDATITWAGCANDDNSPTGTHFKDWYNAGLGAMYTAFTKMRAGASSYVMAAVQDLYKSIYLNTDKVSVAIKNAILSNIPTTSTPYATASGETLTFDDAIKGYPSTDNNMPEGAAALAWTANSSGILQAAPAASNYGGPTSGASEVPAMNIVKLTDIVYPASLYYYVSSPIRVSNVSREANYTAEASWNTILNSYSTTTGAVSSTTRSVAIEEAIQYAVGRLDVTVNKLNLANYYDKRGEPITIPTEGFQLTGVLIGGQKAVDYAFTQKTEGDEYTIYDKIINSNPNSVTASAGTTTTYTLGLQTGEGQSVYVALEFVNNADDFQGYDGVVKHGCKFYMIAQLKPDDTGTGGTATDTNSIGKVFKQDFKTIANFTFGAGTADGNGDGVSDTPGGFANAYTTIPDLRTPQLELGLSVDLHWQEGITFNVTF